MKIELATAAAPNLHFRMQDGAAVGFTEMLAPGDQAIRFDGIGVFGLAAATKEPATAAAEEADRVLDLAEAEAATARPSPVASVRHDMVGTEKTANSVETGTTVGTARAPVCSLSRAETLPVATADGVETRPIEVSKCLEPTSPVESARAPGGHRSPQKIVEQVRLEPNDPTGASVVVAGAALSPDEAVRFRARAETLLREHGLTLRNLILFGGPRGAAAPSQRSPRPWR